MLFSFAAAAKRFEVIEGGTFSPGQWNEKCRLQGGRLASIDSAIEQDAVKIALRGTHKGAVLTAMKRTKPGSPIFVTGDGYKLMYT